MNSDRIEGAARDIGGKVQGLVGRAAGSNQLHAEGLINEAAGTVQNLYGQAVDGVRDATDTVTDYAERAYDRGSRYVQRSSRSVETQVSQHPLTMIMVAGALGFAIGVIVMSNRG